MGSEFSENESVSIKKVFLKQIYRSCQSRTQINCCIRTVADFDYVFIHFRGAVYWRLDFLNEIQDAGVHL